MNPVFASMITKTGLAVTGSVALHGLPAVSKTTLQPTPSSSVVGLRVRPAGLQTNTAVDASITPVIGLIFITAPSGVFPFTSGMVRKNRCVPGSHTGCSAPFVANDNGIVSERVSPPFASTSIKVANGGVSALLITSSFRSLGSNASSSARFGLLDVVVSPTVAPFVRLIVTTRLPPSVTNSKFPKTVTPLGPLQLAPPRAVHTAVGTNPANGGFAGSCVTNVLLAASATSTTALERSAR